MKEISAFLMLAVGGGAAVRWAIAVLRKYLLSRIGLHLPPTDPIPPEFRDSFGFIRDHCRVIPFRPPPILSEPVTVHTPGLMPPELLEMADSAGRARVVLLGEHHHFREFHDLRNRLLFHLAGRHGFSAIILEDRFSLTPFACHFVSVDSEEGAREFSRRYMSPLIRTEEDMNFLELVRKWNSSVRGGESDGPEIKVLFSDLEHDFSTTFEHIVDPFLAAHGVEVPPLPEDMTRFELASRVEFIQKALASIRAERRPVDSRRTAELPGFMTLEFIESVSMNLQSTLWAHAFDFNFFRQRAILRNLLDPEFLGDPFSKERVLISCGSQHAESWRQYPIDGSFLREGAYLNYDHPSSAGSAYSIQVVGSSRKLGSWKVPDRKAMIPQGIGYFKAVERRLKASRWGLADPERHLLDRSPSKLGRILLQLSQDHGGNPFLLDSADWDLMADHFAPDREMTYYLEECREQFCSFDKTIFFPNGSLTRAREKTAVRENAAIRENAAVREKTAGRVESSLETQK